MAAGSMLSCNPLSRLTQMLTSTYRSRLISKNSLKRRETFVLTVIRLMVRLTHEWKVWAGTFYFYPRVRNCESSAFILQPPEIWNARASIFRISEPLFFPARSWGRGQRSTSTLSNSLLQISRGRKVISWFETLATQGRLCHSKQRTYLTV